MRGLTAEDGSVVTVPGGAVVNDGCAALLGVGAYAGGFSAGLYLGGKFGVGARVREEGESVAAAELLLLL